MALYVVPVASPAAGADWQAVVPGQYLWNVTGITATLAVPGDLDALADISGNGHVGHYEMNGGYPVPAPGIIAGDGAMQMADPAVVASAGGFDMPALGFNMAGDFTIEFWATLSTLVDQTGFAYSTIAFAPARQIWFSLSDGGAVQFVRQQPPAAQEYQWTLAGIVDDGVPHSYVLVYEAGAATLYVDTVVIAPDVADPPVALNPVNTASSAFVIRAPNNGVNATADEYAIYPYALSAAQVFAHDVAASGGIAPYTAAVLADSPAVYYHLDETVGAPRQVDLVVTDGTDTVLEIPTGFAPPSPPGPFGYSWSPTLRSSTQTPTGDTIAVAIPRLVVPAGYTLGTRTLDIGAEDQWSDVTVWWNSDVMDAAQPIEPYAYPPGALLALKYQMEGR